MGNHTKFRIKILQTHTQKIPIIKNPNKYINGKKLNHCNILKKLKLKNLIPPKRFIITYSQSTKKGVK